LTLFVLFFSYIDRIALDWLTLDVELANCSWTLLCTTAAVDEFTEAPRAGDCSNAGFFDCDVEAVASSPASLRFVAVEVDASADALSSPDPLKPAPFVVPTSSSSDFGLPFSAFFCFFLSFNFTFSASSILSFSCSSGVGLIVLISSGL
jgi:hypothetical protein